MPIYEYECQACGHRFEEIQGFSDKPLTRCPECKKPKLHKLVSAPTFHLKGTGWYVTDFKNSGKKAESSESTPKKEETKTASKDKSESKTSTKETKKDK